MDDDDLAKILISKCYTTKCFFAYVVQQKWITGHHFWHLWLNWRGVDPHHHGRKSKITYMIGQWFFLHSTTDTDYHKHSSSRHGLPIWVRWLAHAWYMPNTSDNSDSFLDPMHSAEKKQTMDGHDIHVLKDSPCVRIWIRMTHIRATFVYTHQFKCPIVINLNP